MAIKRVDESPTIADQIIFDILTPDSNDCFLGNPFKVDNVTIYFIEREFISPNFGEYDKEIFDQVLLEQLAAAQKVACDDPTVENLEAVSKIQEEVSLSKEVNTFFFKDARPVAVFGNDETPAWLSTDVENALITEITEDEDGNPQFGHFELEWNPVGQREGDYFICWTWSPVLVGDKLKAHIQFDLGGATQLTTAIPTHFTDPEKYETLQERYLPEMFKMTLTDDDLSPQVILGLNNSVAAGFTLLEDLTNQIVDLLDANALHEGFLPLLSNLFNLKLKSDDPTRWRRQIKRAVPLFKRKGTLGGLQEAFEQAGMELKKFTRLWQVLSPFTFQEAFDVVDSLEFTLSKKAILPVDLDNFQLFFRGVDDDEYVELTADYVTLAEVDGVTIMTWVGETLSIDPITLAEGDTVRVLYEVVNVPDQSIEDAIRALPLLDQRDERDQCFPPKNWNTRVIEEDDPLFDVIIPTRHPFQDPVIFGTVRTEFPYSENVYCMEEYNGSTRESTDPCDIDKDFIDACEACQSSKFNVDVEIENLSNDRILEALDVLEEFTPFHAVLHSINISGLFVDFIQPKDELEILVLMAGEEFMISGNGQHIFNRAMREEDFILRDELATSTTVVSGASGTATNNDIVLFAPDVNFEELFLNQLSNVLEVLAPHPEAGTYTVDSPNRQRVIVTGVSEPFSQSQFTFLLSNITATVSPASITRDDLFTFEDEEVDFAELGVKSEFDIANTPDYTGGAWVVEIGATEYTVLDVHPDGVLVLEDGIPALSASTGVSYTLKDDVGATITSSTTGEILVRERGLVDISSFGFEDARNFVKIGDFVLFSGVQYPVISFKEGEANKFYIDFDGSTSVGVSIDLLRRILDNQVGNFAYQGLTLTTLVDHEVGLGILNGVNAPASPDDILEDNLFKENFLIFIDPDNYAMAEIDGMTITLNGPFSDFTLAGTAVAYDIIKFEKVEDIEIPPVELPVVPGHTFDFIDRRGNEVIEVETEMATTMSYMASALNAAKHNEILDSVSLGESITIEIEYADGKPKETHEIN